MKILRAMEWVEKHGDAGMDAFTELIMAIIIVGICLPFLVFVALPMRLIFAPLGWLMRRVRWMK